MTRGDPVRQSPIVSQVSLVTDHNGVLGGWAAMRRGNSRPAQYRTVCDGTARLPKHPTVSFGDTCSRSLGTRSRLREIGFERTGPTTGSSWYGGPTNRGAKSADDQGYGTRRVGRSRSRTVETGNGGSHRVRRRSIDAICILIDISGEVTVLTNCFNNDSLFISFVWSRPELLRSDRRT